MSSLKVLIVKIEKIVPHKNAENLELAIVGGWPIIIRKELFKEGDLAVYIPIDSILPLELSDAIGCTKYLGSGGHVKAAKLRSVPSYGILWNMEDVKVYLQHAVAKNIEDVKVYLKNDPIEISMIKFTNAFNLLCEGDDLTEVLHITKWEPPINYNDGDAERPHSLFDKYTDIENYRNYNKIIHVGEEVIVTEKIHGCLEAKTKILLADGSTKSIKEIVDNKIDTLVVGQNQFGEILPTKILNYFNNGISNNWLKIYYNRRGFGTQGNYYGIITCTENHKIFIQNQYVMANQLKIGDKISNIKRYNELTYIQESILIGKMLGDGSLNIDNNNTAHIQYSHVEKYKDYILYIKNSLGYIAQDSLGYKTSGFGSKMICNNTITHPIIYDIFTKWIINNKKTIPENLILNPISLAVWYMDDGSLCEHELQEDRANFATCGFDEHSIDILLNTLKMSFGINGIKYQTDAENYWRIRLNAIDAEKLYVIISPYVPKIMEYKLPHRFRNKQQPLLDTNICNYKKIIYEQEIIKIEKINRNICRYDLETETHNFFANEILVHNSNARYGLINEEDTEVYMVGSHNVRKKESANSKYWSVFSADLKEMLKQIKDESNAKVVIAYGEIYGKSIQDLTYGRNDFALRLFDIKVNDDYMSYDNFIRYCEKFNIATVPLLYRGPFSLDKILSFEGDSVLGGSIKEGCVIKPINERIDDHIGRTILKYVYDSYYNRKNGTEFK